MSPAFNLHPAPPDWGISSALSPGEEVRRDAIFCLAASQHPEESLGDHWRLHNSTEEHQRPLQTIGDHRTPLETVRDCQRPQDTTGDHWTPLEHHKGYWGLEMAFFPSEDEEASGGWLLSASSHLRYRMGE